MSTERYTVVLTDSKGKILEVPLRRGFENTAFIDQISFSFHIDSLISMTKEALISNEEFVIEMSLQLQKIFGFGVSEKWHGSGGRFYETAYMIGTENALYGRLHIGGQQNTMLVEISATGCNAADDGWEQRLHEFLNKCIRPKITRVDITKDFFHGEYSPEQAREDRLKGLFTGYRTMPSGEAVGTDWDSDTKTGKTYYIGSRQSSKFVRVYEKGKQLGDENSNWVRFEIEFKSRDILIPLDMLIVPHEYFAGAYPICKEFEKTKNYKRPDSVNKIFETTKERVVEIAKTQVGRVINMLIQLYQGQKTDSEILYMLKPDHDELPKRLDPARFLASFSDYTPIHLIEKIKMPDDFGLIFEVSEIKSQKIARHLNFQREMKNFDDYLSWGLY